MLPQEITGFKVTKDLSISFARANLQSIVIMFPIFFVLIIPYALLWGWLAVVQIFAVIKNKLLLSLVIFFAGTVLHELIHGFSWKIFGSLPFTTIKFGFNWKWLTPFAHCKQPMEIKPYRFGAALPGVILGLIPACAGMLSNHKALMAFGLFFTIAASGDWMILWLIRKVKSGELIFDHPSRAGCFVLRADVNK